MIPNASETNPEDQKNVYKSSERGLYEGTDMGKETQSSCSEHSRLYCSEIPNPFAKLAGQSGEKVIKHAGK